MKQQLTMLGSREASRASLGKRGGGVPGGRQPVRIVEGPRALPSSPSRRASLARQPHASPSLKHHRLVVVHNHPVLQVPPHRLGQHRALQVAALHTAQHSTAQHGTAGTAGTAREPRCGHSRPAAQQAHQAGSSPPLPGRRAHTQVGPGCRPPTHPPPRHTPAAHTHLSDHVWHAVSVAHVGDVLGDDGAAVQVCGQRRAGRRARRGWWAPAGVRGSSASPGPLLQPPVRRQAGRQAGTATQTPAP